MTRMPAIEYGICTRSEAAAMTRLLAEVFTRHDPPAWAVGLTPAEFERFVQALLPQVTEEGLTVVARRCGTGELVGALIANDPARETAAGMETLSEKFAPIASILGELVTRYRSIKQPKPGQLLHLYLLGVAASAGGRGVAQQLVAACLDNGAHKGFKMAAGEATNPTSQHIFRKHGFEERGQILYRDYLFNGRHIFAGIAEFGGPILMEKRLAPPDAA